MSQKIHPKSLRLETLTSCSNSYYSEKTPAVMWKQTLSSQISASGLLSGSTGFKSSKAPSSQRRKKSNFFGSSFYTKAIGNKVHLYLMPTLLPQTGFMAKFAPIQKGKSRRSV